MTDDQIEAVSDAIENATDGFVTGWFVFIQYAESETGAMFYESVGMPGQTATTTLGYIESAGAIQREHIVRNHFAQP